MSSLRGGFKSAARKVTGTGPASGSRGRSIASNAITVLLVLVAVALLLRRFGVHHR